MRDFRISVINPARVAAAVVAIVIPARNEVERIAACLESLAAQDALEPFAMYGVTARKWSLRTLGAYGS